MDAVANHIWQSTIVALAAGALAWTFRHNSASVRYWIWFAAATKFLLPFAALAAVANRIPLPQSPPVAGEALEAASVVFRSSAFPRSPAPHRRSSSCMWLFGAFVVLVQVGVAMASSGRRCSPFAARSGGRRARHAPARRARGGHRAGRRRLSRRVTRSSPACSASARQC